MLPKTLIGLIAFSIILFSQSQGFSDDLSIDRRIPDEYETVGGHALGFGNAGVAAAGGLSAVRLNPGLLSMAQTYSIAGGYNWPSFGRDFFHAGVVDSKTSRIAAGFNYTGFIDNYDGAIEKDSSLKRRFSLSVGHILGKVSAGIGVQYLEAISLDTLDEEASVKGTTIGAGFAGLITSQLRYGISVENLANRKVSEYAPRIIRGGVAYLFGTDQITTHLDFRQRERVSNMEGGFDIESLSLSSIEKVAITKEDKNYKNSEQMFIGSFSARIYDMLRLLGAYGHSISKDQRRSLSGGLAIINGNTSLSYTASRPYMSNPVTHEALNLAFAVAF